MRRLRARRQTGSGGTGSRSLPPKLRHARAGLARCGARKRGAAGPRQSVSRPRCSAAQSALSMTGVLRLHYGRKKRRGCAQTEHVRRVPPPRAPRFRARKRRRSNDMQCTASSPRYACRHLSWPALSPAASGRPGDSRARATPRHERRCPPAISHSRDPVSSKIAPGGSRSGCGAR